MTDEKFIYDFLDSGYKVTIGSSDYLFVELETNKILPHKSTYGDNMLSEFEKIIGNFDTDTGESSTNVLYRWYMEQSKIVGEELNKFIESYDGKEGFSVILNEAFSKFGSDYNKPFLRTKIGEHYKHKYLTTKVQDYLDTLDYSKGSKKLIEEVKLHFDDDIDEFLKYITDCFDWHFQEMLGHSLMHYMLNRYPNLTIIPCFPTPVYYMQKPQFNLWEICKLETLSVHPEIDPYQYVNTRQDHRRSHLTQINHRILANLISYNLMPGIFVAEYTEFQFDPLLLKKEIL